MSNIHHQPVLLEPILDHLKTSQTLWDATLGLAGHSSAYLDKLRGTLFASDQDSSILSLAKERLNSFSSERFHIAHSNFRQDPFPDQKFDAILVDLGISSLHLDYFQRGISYQNSQPLDMRLNQNTGEPVSKFINNASEAEIASVLFDYGEEPKSRKIAKFIVNARNISSITRSDQLREIIINAIGKKRQGRYVERNPATRTFQALRIFVNDELSALQEFLQFAPSKLNPNGKLMVISFHSLEDRIVKNRYRSLWRVPSDNPRYTFFEGEYQILTKKPIIPSESEIRNNPRCRSAKLRILQKKQ